VDGSDPLQQHSVDLPDQGAAQRGAQGLDVTDDRLDDHRCLRGPERADEPAGCDHGVWFHHVSHGVQKFGAPAGCQSFAVAELGDDPYEPGFVQSGWP
jgi:hypothetical protein